MAKIQRDNNINKPGTLGAKLHKIVGNPTYKDEPSLKGSMKNMELSMSLYWRLKWPFKFTDNQHVKLKEALVGYEEFLVEYERSFQQIGRALDVVSVLKFTVDPGTIRLKSWDKIAA